MTEADRTPAHVTKIEALLRALKQSGRYDLYAVLAAASVAACMLLAFRLYHYNSHDYAFLGWNLMLAAIPFVVSQWLLLFTPRTGVRLAAGVLFWLLFFPNAPYIVTDLIHLHISWPVPLWFDVVMLFSFAAIGVLFGLVSLLDVHRVVEAHTSRVAGWSFTCTAVVLGSFGVYVGRYLRWNSWNVLTHPIALLSDVAHALLHPIADPTAYGVTGLFSLFLMMGYMLLRSLSRLKLAGEPFGGPGRKTGP
jgi:uncharacterized membrane protein